MLTLNFILLPKFVSLNDKIMKKLIISGFLLTNVFSFCYAQDPALTPAATPVAVAPIPATVDAPAAPAAPAQATKESPSLKFGLKFTPTYCWFKLDRTDYDTDGGYVGYIYGIMTDFRIADNYYFATGVEVSQRGGKYKSDNLILNDDPLITEKGVVTQRLQFVDIPFSLKLKTNEIGYSRYYGTFGFLTGFTVKANQDIDFEDPTMEDRDKRDNMSDFGFFNFGLLVGAGMEYNFSGNTALSFGIQYHNSFVDVWDVQDAKINPNYIPLNLGLFF